MAKRLRSKQKPNRDELLEVLDDLFAYFEMDDASFTEAPYITMHTADGYMTGVVDVELQNILFRIFETVHGEGDEE